LLIVTEKNTLFNRHQAYWIRSTGTNTSFRLINQGVNGGLYRA